MGVAALIKGIFYDEAALAATRASVGQPKPAEVKRFTGTSGGWGCNPLRRPHPAGSGTGDPRLCPAGADPARQKNALGQDETIYLDGLDEIAESGVTLAERLLGRWHGSRREKVASLLAHCGYR